MDDLRAKGREEADRLDAEAAKLQERLRALREEAAITERQLAVFREAARLLRSGDAAKSLQRSSQPPRVNSNMVESHRIAISRGRRPERKGAKADPFTAAMHGRGLTLRSLAPLVGVTPTYLSFLRSGKRHPSDEVRARIKAVLGYVWPPA